MVDAKRNPYDVAGVKPSITARSLTATTACLSRTTMRNSSLHSGVPKEFAIIGIEKRAALSEA